MALLKVKYGAQTNNLPSLSDGTMYVHTGTTSTLVGTNNIYNANLYFDLGDKRYQIQATTAEKVANKLTLQLNSTQLGSQYDGHEAITWNIPLAANVAAGLISNAAQSIYGAKTFKAATTLESTLSIGGTTTAQQINPSTNNTYDLGTSSLKWAKVYATTFYGALSGKATSAGTADKVTGKLTAVNTSNTTTKTYNGAADIAITLADLIDGTIPLTYIPAAAQERIVAYGSLTEAQTALSDGDLQPGDMVHISGTGVMYYVKDAVGNGNPTLESFTAGVASQANHVANKLKLQLGDSNNVTEYNGSQEITWLVPYATGSLAGIISTSSQTFAGAKTFSNAVTLSSGFTSSAASTISGTLTTASIAPSANNASNIGTSDNKYKAIYATTLYGALSGRATSAGSVDYKLSFDPGSYGLGGGSAKVEYNGSAAVTIGLFKGAAASAAGQPGLVPAPASGVTNKFLRSNGSWDVISVSQGTGISVTGSGFAYTIAHASVPIGTTSNVGPGADVTLGRASGNAASFTVPYLTVDSLGHVSSKTTHTITLGTISSTYGSSDGATKIATVLGTDIYAGTEWGTF